ncbi:MAG: hypothetical protein AB7Q81_19115 [Gammaproteobacteria bacterium]
MPASFTRIAAVAVAIAAACPAVHAGPIAAPDFAIAVAGEGGGATFTGLAFDHLGGNLWHTAAGGSDADTTWSTAWDLVIDPDPVISGTFSITNVLATPQPFTILLNLGLGGALLGPLVQQGALVASLVDGAGDGASVSAVDWGGIVNGSLFGGLLDGSESLDLTALPLAASCGAGDCPLALGGGAIDSGEQVYTGAVPATAMGIRLSFILSAGDTLAVSTSYRIEPGMPMDMAVPEPRSLALLLSAVAALRRRPRRECFIASPST